MSQGLARRAPMPCHAVRGGPLGGAGRSCIGQLRAFGKSHAALRGMSTSGCAARSRNLAQLAPGRNALRQVRGVCTLLCAAVWWSAGALSAMAGTHAFSAPKGSIRNIIRAIRVERSCMVYPCGTSCACASGAAAGPITFARVRLGPSRAGCARTPRPHPASRCRNRFRAGLRPARPTMCTGSAA